MDLDLIKQEIDSRKKEKKVEIMNEGHDVPLARDEFLHGLQQSLATGQPNKATAKLNIVKERSDNMQVAGGQVINQNTAPVNQQVINEVAHTQHPVNVNPNPNYNPNAGYPQQPTNPNGNPREEQFYKNLQETKQILGNSSNNLGVADAITQWSGNQNQGQGQQMISSPNALNEAVNNAVQNFMTNHFANIVEQAMKGTMMEIYAKERVEIALNENKDMIQKMVVNTILALQKKNQKKTTK